MTRPDSRRGLPSVVVLFALLVLLVGCAASEQAETGEDVPAAADAEAAAPEAAAEVPAKTTTPAPGRPAASTPPSAPASAPEAAAGTAPEAAVPAGMVLVPAGQVLEVELLTALSTKTTEPGTTFEANIKRGFWMDDLRVPAKQWTILGTVASVTAPKKKKDLPGEMELSFETILTEDGQEFAVAGYATEFGESARKRNIGVVAGAAVVGAIIGKEAGGDTEDALIGAAAGAAAGAGVVRALPGRHLNLDEGTEMMVTLVEDVLLPYRQN